MNTELMTKAIFYQNITSNSLLVKKEKDFLDTLDIKKIIER